MTNLNQTERKTLDVIARSFFTFKGDSHFRSYRQATTTLNRLERLGLVKREDHDQNMFVMTPLAYEWRQYPNVALEDVREWMAA